MPMQVLSPKLSYQKLGISRATYYRLLKSGDLPAQIQLSSGRVGQIEAALDSWLQKRIDESIGVKT